MFFAEGTAKFAKLNALILNAHTKLQLKISISGNWKLSEDLNLKLV